MNPYPPVRGAELKESYNRPSRLRNLSHPGLRVILLQILLSDQSSDETIES